MKTIEEVVEEVKKEREEQMKKWDPGQNRDYAHRPFEEWMLLMEQYVSEMRAEYKNKPGKAAARAKLLKAVNLGLWGLQSDASTD